MNFGMEFYRFWTALGFFSSDFFNINADEAWDLVRGSMKTVADNIGPGQLYAQHVVPLTEHLLARQKRPMIWGDMLLAHQA